MFGLTLVGVGCAGDSAREAVTVPWITARPADGGRLLRIGYESDPCTRARQARVEENRETVSVTLLDPDREPQQACILLAEPGCAVVVLDEPLNGRRVVDGAEEQIPVDESDLRDLPFSRYEPCRRVPVV